MASAFIIRPFGTKNGIDFDRVERELIDPALREFEITGRTTGDSLKQGNIRTEMFQRLLTADLVVVDISINNANVFYELGIRHALRNKRTFMIRGAGEALPPDDVPFDLRTDRYLSYDPRNPGAALPTLTQGLRQTLFSSDKDSPVFQLLPDLAEQDRARFLIVPKDFQEAVERALQQPELRYQWGDLKLLQTEVQGLLWEIEGLKIIGRAQLSKKAYEYARDTWEAIRQYDPEDDDREANARLGTIYQRLGNLTESNIALKRVLQDHRATPRECSEAHSLLGSNLKQRWKAQWAGAPPEERRAEALRSPFLKQLYEEYRQGFIEDLTNFHAGVNALGMLTVITELAHTLPDVWSESFEEEDEAARQLEKARHELLTLRGSVSLSLTAAEDLAKRTGKPDMWMNIARADFMSLTSNRPSYVASLYRDYLADAQDFEVDAVRRQLVLYEQLGVATANVVEALKKIPASLVANERPPHTLFFTGHRIDSPERQKPRFPADKENVAREAIKAAIEKELLRVESEHADCRVIGIAGGASGGDILFLEVCEELKIPISLELAFPHDAYAEESVQNAGVEWVNRFYRLYERLPHREMGPSKELPRWLHNKPDYGIWQRNNLWTLYTALAYGSQYATLIALWDGSAGDGPGGTEDMVNIANRRGAKTIILNTKQLFGLS